MKIINSYFLKTFLTYNAICISIVTFVMLAGQFARLVDLLSQGISIATMLHAVAYRIPQTLQYTLPISALTSTVLLFHRFSADNELTALRTSGISIHQIIAPFILISVIFSILCFFFQFYIVPKSVYKANNIVRNSAINPVRLVQVGQFIEVYKGFILYVGQKQNDKVWDVHIYIVDNNYKVQRKIDARRGEITVDSAQKILNVRLSDAVIEIADAKNRVEKSRRLGAKNLHYPIPYGAETVSESLVQGLGYMTLPQLMAWVQISADTSNKAVVYRTEIGARAAMALSPFSFVLLGIPLGIRTVRRESHSHLLWIVVVPLAYYAAIEYSSILLSEEKFHVEAILWLPNLVCQFCGLYLLWLKR